MYVRIYIPVATTAKLRVVWPSFDSSLRTGLTAIPFTSTYKVSSGLEVWENGSMGYGRMGVWGMEEWEYGV